MSIYIATDGDPTTTIASPASTTPAKSTNLEGDNTGVLDSKGGGVEKPTDTNFDSSTNAKSTGKVDIPKFFQTRKNKLLLLAIIYCFFLHSNNRNSNFISIASDRRLRRN